MLYGDAQPSVIAVPNPGTGNAPSFAVPGSEALVVVAVSFQLVTSAVVATRTPIVEVTDGAGVLIVGAVAGFGATASGTFQYTFAHGLAEWDSVTPAAGTQFASGPGPLLPLGVGDTITVAVANLDAGDALTNLRLVVLQDAIRDDAEAH